MTSSNCRFLNPSVTTLLEAHQGILFFLNSFKSSAPCIDKRRSGEELAITCLVSGNVDSLEELEKKVFYSFLMFMSMLVPMLLHSWYPPNGARLAVVGHGGRRRASKCQYSDCQLESEATLCQCIELLLSNNGDQILEGCLTNLLLFFQLNSQTVPIRDGVLPGVVRQVFPDICSRNKIPVREIAPSWSEREMWSEAFITSSLRLLQHVEVIQAPSSWESLDTQTWTDKEVMEMASMEGYPVSLFDDR
ncbi:hypothetical protein R3W88_011871 [Solanum pinnatisectum]|uniref:Uncharacterized protein n=1 Tax=Solanum pinnatisectum TaxID=50273 RepID=A0AAV9L7V3_9SOLN|nr:hypothetical protein R3W88_011871 [Solanum pinnatisectum]